MDDSGVSEIIGALLLIIVVAVSVAALGLFISKVQKEEMERRAYISYVQNEKLEIVDLSLEPSNPLIIYELVNTTNESERYYLEYVNSSYIYLINDSKLLCKLLNGSYNKIDVGVRADLDVVNRTITLNSGNYTFVLARWKCVNFTIRNLNVQDSSVRGICINGVWLDSWTSNGRIYNSSFPMPVPARSGVSVSVSNLNVTKFDKLEIKVMTTALNFFTRIFEPPVPTIDVKTKIQDLGVTKRDIIVFSASTDAYWRIDVQNVNCTSWNDLDNITTVFVRGKEIEYRPESLFNLSEIKNLKVESVRVFLIAFNEYGMMAKSGPVIIPEDSRIAPEGSLRIVNVSGSKIVAHVADIFGRDMAGVAVQFIKIGGENLTHVEPFNYTDSYGNATCNLEWSPNAVVGDEGLVKVICRDLPPIEVIVRYQ